MHPTSRAGLSVGFKWKCMHVQVLVGALVMLGWQPGEVFCEHQL